MVALAADDGFTVTMGDLEAAERVGGTQPCAVPSQRVADSRRLSTSEEVANELDCGSRVFFHDPVA